MVKEEEKVSSAKVLSKDKVTPIDNLLREITSEGYWVNEQILLYYLASTDDEVKE